MNKEIKLLIGIVLIALIISITLNIISYLITKKKPYREKTSVYECGFNPFNSPSSPFSIKFFLVAIIFLIFDLEIIFIFPWSSSIKTLPMYSHLIMTIFIIFITWGLIYEWFKGALEW